MRNYFLFLFVFLFSGCLTSNHLDKISTDRYSIKNNKVIFFDDKPYAELQSITWSLDDGELVKEFNFKLLDTQDLNVIGGMIDFISDRHNGDEVEVEFNVEPNSEQFKL